MSLSERIQQLNREIGATVERALAELRQEVGQRLRASNEEVQRRLDELVPTLPDSYLSHEDLLPAAERELGPGTRRDALRDLRDAVAVIDRARSQADILNALLRESLRYAARAAVLLNRGNELRGWGSQGFGDAEAAVRELALDASRGAWSRLAQGEGALRLSASECADLCSRLESPLPQGGAVIPVILRDRVAAGLYADRLDDGDLSVEALQVLAYAAAQAIETLPFRERPFTSTLVLLDGDAPVADPQPEPRVVSAPAPPPAAVAAPEPEVEDVQEVEVEAEPEPAPVAEPAPWSMQEEPAAAPAPESAVTTQSWALPSYEEEPAAAPASGELGTQSTPVAAMEEEVPGYPRSVEPEPAGAFQSASPEATVLLPRSALVSEPEPPAPPPLRPVPAPEPAGAFGGASSLGAASGTPEVRPPSGVDGPGWAFATTRVPVAPNTESLHEEARRLARLLVSEIKLYNEEQVEEGRRNRDIYERLKEDIDRSRQMYDERVDPQVLRSTDYFYQELVRILAAGDSKALGI
ncbi:MAG TPA: hypothetical protein VF789_01805 [Thermoanaerobaculia bacterium]